MDDPVAGHLLTNGYILSPYPWVLSVKNISMVTINVYFLRGSHLLISLLQKNRQENQEEIQMNPSASQSQAGQTILNITRISLT